jgi:adenosylcobalamin-dependent ribonucleoside-triphosphate reductase
MKSFSRMNGYPDNKDIRVSGGNPCLEQSLESMELCCLVETFPNKHENIEDFKATLKSAFLFAKTVTLLPLHWQKSNEIMMRNRRIGCSVSGIAQFITDHGLNELKTWLETGYDTLKDIDKEISEWLCVRQSIKMTSVKPSGTVSLLAGATPGIHYPESKYYIRRIRMARDSYLLIRLIKAGYHVEPCSMCPESTVVVEFPVCAGVNIRTVKEVSMWEQLSLAAFMQKYWADNQVSATITFDSSTEGSQIANALNYFQYQLKGISFLPRLIDDTIYKQIPYEGISEEQYNNICGKINKNVSLSTGIEVSATDDTQMTYCDNDRCMRI